MAHMAAPDSNARVNFLPPRDRRFRLVKLNAIVFPFSEYCGQFPPGGKVIDVFMSLHWPALKCSLAVPFRHKILGICYYLSEPLSGRHDTVMKQERFGQKRCIYATCDNDAAFRGLDAALLA
jgi:hypothetical protein